MKTLFPIAVASAALWLTACASNPAEDPVQIKLTDVDTRLGTVERVVSNQSLVDMSRRLDSLEAQLREQRGSVEVLQNGGETVRKEQHAVYADLDKRIAALEGSVHPVTGVVPGTVVDTATGAADSLNAAAAVDDQSAYSRAFEKLKNGSYGDATVAFQSFMKRYPSSAMLDNAQYWIGEAYYVTRDYDRAAQAFRAVGERWPSSRKAPDAMLKLGYTQYEQKHLKEARGTLNQVIEHFPGTDAARLAQERLQKIPDGR